MFVCKASGRLGHNLAPHRTLLEGGEATFHIDNLEAPVGTNIGVEGFLMLFVNHTTRTDPRLDHPFDVFRSWSGTRLVTNSFLLFWLPTIKD